MDAEPLSIGALPVAVLPLRGESGQGLLLRASRANALSLGMLYRLAGGDLSADPTHLITSLACLANVSHRWLEHHAILEESDGGRRRWKFLGHRWTASISLRRNRPQVCPECLIETKYCRAVWDVTGYVVCPAHGLLQNTCAHCGAEITWRRPALTVCRCRWMFGRSQTSAPVPAIVNAWSQWVANRAAASASAPGAIPGGEGEIGLLPRWIHGLNVDAAFQIVFALGLRSAQHERISTTSTVAMRSPDEIAQIIERGIERGRVLDDLSAPALAGLDGWIYEQGIERLARRAVDVADRTFAGTLQHALHRSNYRCQTTGRKPSMYQPDLFEECFDG